MEQPPEAVGLRDVRPKSPNTGNHGDAHGRSSEESEHTLHTTPTRDLRMRKFPVLLVILYAAVAVAGWALTCTASRRPITTPSYGYVQQEDGEFDRVYDAEEKYARNERYIRAGQGLRIIAAVFVVPVTSSICAAAAAAYTQDGKRGRHLSLRQTMALADRGWISISNWTSARVSLGLFLATVVVFLGILSQILLNSWVNLKTIRVPDDISSQEITDVPSLFDEDFEDAADEVAALLRSSLAVVHSHDIEPLLWLENPESPTCNMNYYCDRSPRRPVAYQDLINDDEQDAAPFPAYFLASVPLDTSTGLFHSQFVPRINSSASYVNITEAEFEEHCSDNSTGFYAQYSSVPSEYRGMSLVACMPGVLSQSPWNRTRDRQDIFETLYLNVTTSFGGGTAYRKATVNTTLGYFELPNYYNGNLPGPLLEEDPYVGNTQNKYRKRDIAPNMTDAGDVELFDVHNKGPLLSLALALFGKDSFLETSFADPERFWDSSVDPDAPYSLCTNVLPLGRLDWEPSSCTSSTTPPVSNDVASLLSVLDSLYNTDQLFARAVYVANKIWLTQYRTQYQDLRLYFDPGMESYAPDLSLAGIIVGSILLGLHIVGLFALALYAFFGRPWTRSLDSFAMMKIGAAYADQFPLRLGYKTSEYSTGFLDRLPGFVGDGTPSAQFGRLEMGAAAPLRANRQYQSSDPRHPSSCQTNPPRYPGPPVRSSGVAQ
ncbi:hypothetical protein BDY21DRAFT_119374 [Lineolata rhizophorae]|uniref:Uncharacterized protein n=1 Tax=Lineolata rhizophorae TaxID=578093 RepID=A0A6A6NQK6_9PEZI|nr:hypothetical protein BDY21DRAFT_119374 [Lineolata rhizophorae]